MQVCALFSRHGAGLARRAALRLALALLAFSSFFVATGTEPIPIRVASWNMGDLSERPGGKAAHAWDLLSSKADVLALQECPTPDSSLDQQEWYGVYEHSNAILSRWPIIQSGLVAANPAWPRDLPWADIEPPSGPAFRIYSVHLTFRRGGTPFLAQAREVEARRILIHASGFDGPVVVAGDFNSIGWILGGQASAPAIQLLQLSGYTDALAAIGGRTHALLGRIDWIYTNGLHSTEPILGDYAGSDHRWLLANLSPSKDDPVQVPTSAGNNSVALLAVTALGLSGIVVWWKRRVRLGSPTSAD